MKILFKNARILDTEKGELFNGSVEVDDNIISKVGDFEVSNSYDRIIDCKGNVLMPGFVNTHAHTPMTLLRSFKDDAPLEEWLFDNILPAEGNIMPTDVYWGEYLGILEGLRAGITTIEEGYFHNDKVYDVVEKSGIRARIGIGPTMRDVGMSNLEYLKKEASLIKANPRIKPACFVHAIYTTSRDVIKESVEFVNKENMPLSIHLSETEKEVNDANKNYGCSPVEYLNNLGFFDRTCLAYHGVHLNQKDMEILNKKGVSVSLCMSSNLKLASGIAPIYELYKNGINLTIGTDGVASNNSLDMFKEMFLVATLSKVRTGRTDVISAKDVLKMATINGAKALGFNAGNIKEGMLADIILIDISGAHYYPQQELVSHLVYAGKSSDVYLTMVDGKILYEEGSFFVGEKKEKIFENANKIREKLRKSL